MKILKRLYDWVLHWADTPYGTPALFVLAFAESSFFPVPPDVLLIALSLSIPKKAFRYAVVCTMGSVLGGMLGFYIGYAFWGLAKEIIFTYANQQSFDAVRDYFIRYEAWAIAAAGFTPIPYKVFTISAGFFRVDFAVFVIASLLARGARFFLVAWLFYSFGPPIKSFIERYFNILTIAFMALLVGGFIVLKFLM
jgi:membrane protein YqaA with SNARE-associated domain